MSARFIPTVKLNNGLEMPAIGLGTSMSKGDECSKAVMTAIDEGFRHIDTAYNYRNEDAVGRAIRAKIEEGVVTREELFVTTKLWNTFHHPDHVPMAFGKSLEHLGLDYVDLFLIHMPFGYEFNGWDPEKRTPLDDNGNVLCSDDDYVDTWKAMEKLLESGRVHSIGVSNFNSEQLERILANCRVKPVTNQVECNARINQKLLIEFCMERDIVVTAHSPFGRPHLFEKNPKDKPKPVLDEPEIVEIGKKFDKSSAQVVLRYLLQNGVVPIPKSTSAQHLKQNLEIFDFELSSDDMEILDGFNTNQRMVRLSLLKEHKYYPFNIPF